MSGTCGKEPTAAVSGDIHKCHWSGKHTQAAKSATGQHLEFTHDNDQR